MSGNVTYEYTDGLELNLSVNDALTYIGNQSVSKINIVDTSTNVASSLDVLHQNVRQINSISLSDFASAPQIKIPALSMSGAQYSADFDVLSKITNAIRSRMAELPALTFL
jgi:hypothetical protein